MDINVTVNGVPRAVNVEPRLLLVDLIRDELGLTGTHIGCDTSTCGACTVLIDGRTAKSCTVLAPQVNGREVTTIEGLAAPGELTPVQESFWNRHALQCGFCTPGMVIAATELLRRTPHPTEEQVRQGLSGNICRCTGYQNIVDAVLDLAGETTLAGVADSGGAGSGDAAPPHGVNA